MNIVNAAEKTIPKQRAMTLIWKNGKDKYYIYTEEGYTVCKIFIDGECRYKAQRGLSWRDKEYKNLAPPSVRTSRAAKQICELDYRKRCQQM